MTNEERTQTETKPARDFVPARRPDMACVWMAEQCGHIVFNAGTVEGDHCYQCDPDYEHTNMGINWIRLYVRSADRKGSAQ